MRGPDDLLDALCRHLETGEADECDLLGLRDGRLHTDRDAIRRSILLAGERIRRALSTQTLVEQLDARTKADGERWDWYRIHDGRHAIELSTSSMGDPLKRRVYGETIEEVLRLAIASKRIPMVPKRPEPVDPTTFRTEKRGSDRFCWHTLDAHGALAIRTETRKKAHEALERYAARIAEEIEAWDTKWAQLTTEGTEGTDFIWEGS